MARPLRITYPGAFYHVTSRGNERKSVFNSKSDREKFLEYLKTAHDRYNAIVHVFCLMDNHYHLLLETPNGNLPQIMHHINGAYTTYFNIKCSRSGHLFHGRYKAILVEMDAYAKELSRYIHLNPVRAKMVKSPDTYAWSSYNFYIGRKKPPQWLQRDFILGFFGWKPSVAERRYEEFVVSLLDREYESPLQGVIGSVLLGTENFIKSVSDTHLRGKKPDRNLPAIRMLVSSLSVEKVIESVAGTFGDDLRLERAAGIYLCRKYSGEKLRTIGEKFGISGAAVSQVYKRLQTKIEKDKKLKMKIEYLERKIKTLNVET